MVTEMLHMIHKSKENRGRGLAVSVMKLDMTPNLHKFASAYYVLLIT